MTSIELARKLYHSDRFWALAGVIIGFSLGEGSSMVRYYFRIWRLKRILREELKSIAYQIDQKTDIIRQARELLAKERILGMRSVHIIAAGYANNITALYPHLTAKERNSLHVIYEKLRTADEILDSFEGDITTAIREKVVAEPFVAYSNRLGDLLENYSVVKRLIAAYLKGKPDDVFYLDEKGGFFG